MSPSFRTVLSTSLVAFVALTSASATAADPLPTTPAAWVSIDTPSRHITGGSADPNHASWSDITQFQFEFVKDASGPGQSLTSITLQRPRGQYDAPFNLPIGAPLSAAAVELRKAAVNGTADWFRGWLKDAKVMVDEVRMSKGATTGTEILVLSFAKLDMGHRIQTAEGYTQYAAVPMQFDIKDNVQLLSSPPALQSVHVNGREFGHP